METIEIFAPIYKTEKTDGGDLIVYGKATGPDLDLDQQICDPKWLAKAMPEWMEFGNVRAQHSNVAAGVGIELTSTEDGSWFLKSRIVDPDTINKIEKGVYKGYSIGIADARVVNDKAAGRGRIVGGFIPEISTVDRPCNPTARMAIAKAYGGAMAPVDATGDIDTEAVTKTTSRAAETVREPKAKRLPAILAPRAHKAAVAFVAKVLGGTNTETDKSAAYGQIADLIVSEAAELKSAGEDDFDVSTLDDAIRALKAITADPEPLTPAVDPVVEVPADGAVSSDVTKATDAATVASTQPADVQKALAKVEQQEAEIANLRADLAKVLATPIPGGPVIMGAAAQQPSAVDIRNAKADNYRRIAAQTSDPGIRKSYLALADQADGDPAKG